jgi:iron complex outermembrane receptor protein
MDIEDLADTRLSTASRHLEDSRKAPAAVTVIHHDEITRYGWRTLSDLLRTVTSVYTAYDRTYSYIGVRGFLESGDYNARVLLLIDGHRLNDNIFDSALIGTEFPLDLDLIDRVEIMRGPGSALYGTDAELAVINVLTRRAEIRPTVKVTAQSQSFLGRTGQFNMSTRIKSAALLFSGSIYRSNGASKLYFPEFDTPGSNSGVANNLDGDRFSHAFAVLTNGQLRLEAAFGTRDKIVPNAPYATNFNDPALRVADTRGYVDASYSRAFRADTQIDFRAYYDAYRFKGSYPYGGTNSPERSVQINDAFGDWVGFEAVLGQRIGRHRAVIGANGEYNLRVNQRNYYLGQTPFLDDNRNLSLAAIYGEAELNFSPKFSMNLGGRADWFSEFGNSFSPRAAFMYFPTASTSVKYVFNRAFRAPDPYDEFYVDNLLPEESVRNLQKERIQSSNLILEHSFNRWLRGTLVGFDTDLLQAISESVDPNTGGTLISNVPGDDGRGLEMEVIADRNDGWSGRASYSFEKLARRGAGSKAANSPSHQGKLNATLPASKYGLLGLEVLYTGSQANFLSQRVSSSTLTNLTLSSRFKNSGWLVSASCYDLFDRRWATPTGPEVLPAATIQDGRTWRISISYKKHFDSERSGR